MTECTHSPTGKHEWETVEENRLERFDWGCIPGTYCLHCEKRQTVEIKRLGPYGDWPKDGH